MKNQTVLITGASEGIGHEFCRIFAEKGYDLVIIARNENKLNEMKSHLSENKNIKVHVIVKDLSKPDAAKEIYSIVKAENINIDILINNAGFGIYNNFWETDYEKEQQMYYVNIMALAGLTNLFAKEMMNNGGGKILNVASTAAFQPGPTMAGYYASKAFVLNYSKAINFEMKDKGVQVSTLCPGPTSTEFQKRAKMEDLNLFKKGLTMTGKEVAQIGYNGLMKGKAVIIAGAMNKLSAMMAKHSPDAIILRVVKKLQSK